MIISERIKEIALQCRRCIGRRFTYDQEVSRIERAIIEATKDLSATIEAQKKEIEFLEKHLALRFGIEKAEPNAGDDPSKDYWIGTDMNCYESRRQAIDSAISKQKE